MTEQLNDRQKAMHNGMIQAQLDANDLRAVRAIIEGDTARIEAHEAAQAELRKLLV